MIKHGQLIIEIQYHGEWYKVRWFDTIYGEYRIEINGNQKDIKKSWVENSR